MVSSEYEKPRSEETKETSLLYKFKKGSQRFYGKWTPALLAAAGILTTSLSTFGAGRSFESDNLLGTAAFGVTALLWGSLTIRQFIKHSRLYNTYREHAVILQKELDKIHGVKRLHREKIHPHHPV